MATTQAACLCLISESRPSPSHACLRQAIHLAISARVGWPQGNEESAEPLSVLPVGYFLRGDIMISYMNAIGW